SGNDGYGPDGAAHSSEAEGAAYGSDSGVYGSDSGVYGSDSGVYGSDNGYDLEGGIYNDYDSGNNGYGSNNGYDNGNDYGNEKAAKDYFLKDFFFNVTYSNTTSVRKDLSVPAPPTRLEFSLFANAQATPLCTTTIQCPGTSYPKRLRQ
ncbi:hypothetical protein SPRG_17881, partial [Saprolegnia parasitica CBS 223.65]